VPPTAFCVFGSMKQPDRCRQELVRPIGEDPVSSCVIHDRCGSNPLVGPAGTGGGAASQSDDRGAAHWMDTVHGALTSQAARETAQKVRVLPATVVGSTRLA
jgi:hypothetical protein